MDDRKVVGIREARRRRGSPRRHEELRPRTVGKEQRLDLRYVEAELGGRGRQRLLSRPLGSELEDDPANRSGRDGGGSPERPAAALHGPHRFDEPPPCTMTACDGSHGLDEPLVHLRGCAAAGGARLMDQLAEPRLVTREEPPGDDASVVRALAVKETAGEHASPGSTPAVRRRCRS